MTRISMRKQLLVTSLITGLVLLVPAVAMEVTGEVAWGPGDFVVAAVLIFAALTGIALGSRLERRSHRLAAIAFVALSFALVWAELAVGLFH
jgi:hypothetical protein